MMQVLELLIVLHSKTLKITSLHDLMETKEKMASLIVKEQLNHFQVKTMMEEKCKNPLAWWIMHEV